MMSSIKISIALATYNGELFLEEQLLSIIDQSHKNWELIISDDGSSDLTLTIIQKYLAIDSRISLIATEKVNGVARNFNRALLKCEANYIVTADQDDIWPIDRLAIMLERFLEVESAFLNTPVLIFTNLNLVDFKNRIISKDFYDYWSINASKINWKNLLWKCEIFGCTMMTNRANLNISLPLPDFLRCHDSWLSLRASMFGNLTYLDYCSINYRQHASNDIGGLKSNIIKSFLNLNKTYNSIKNAVLITKLQNNYLYKENSKLVNLKTDLPSKILFILNNIYANNTGKKLHALVFSLIYILS